MTQKFPLYLDVYLDALPRITGKTWAEWDHILNTSLQPESEALAVTQYLITHYKLKPAWAQMIAMHYIPGGDKPQRPS